MKQPSEMPAHEIPYRILEMRGEARANILRMVAIIIFYGGELLDFHFFHGVTREFQSVSTAIAIAWVMVSLLVWYAFKIQRYSPALKYVSTGVDFTLLTFIISVAHGPSSPMCMIFCLAIVLSGLRWSIRLIQFSTAAALLSYGVLFFQAEGRMPGRAVPPHHALIYSLCFLFTGVYMAQMLKLARKLLKTEVAHGPS